MSQITYRPDIDGLRAVAVLAVVVFHACPAGLPGGFTGVDMFFVISGYLISGIVYKGRRENTFTYADFYARRVRRIVPALIAAVALCLCYGWLVLLPAEYEQLGGHVAAGAVFLQNVAFWNESGYFDTAATLKPLLHLWSLAVEEQIYLVFPPIVLLVLRMRWPLLPVLAVLLVASFVANLVMADRSVSADFFLTPFRAWEFLAGAILAWIHDRRGCPTALQASGEPSSSPPPGGSSAPAWLAEAASWTGVAILVAGLAWIDEQEPYPGWRALVPVLGTLLVIAAGKAASFNRGVLSLAPIVWVGLISYPLYLFHWPLLSFLHIVKGANPAPRLVAAAVGLSVALAVATFYGLEKRIRHNRWRWTVPILLAGFLAVGAAGFGVWKGRIPPKPPSPDVRLVDRAIADGRTGWLQYQDGYRCRSVRGIAVWRCGGEGPQTLFLGDSNMIMYAPRIRKVLEESGSDRGAIFVAKGGSCPVPGVTRDDIEGEEHLIPVFEAELESDPAIDRVVVGARWNTYLQFGISTIEGTKVTSDAGVRKVLDAFGRLIERCRSAGKHVTVVLDIPSAPPMDPNRMLARSLTGGRILRTEPFPVTTWTARNQRVKALAEVAAAEGADVIDPVPFLSDDGTCLAIDENGPIRSDIAHLRGSFVRDHVTYLDAKVADAPGTATGVVRPRPSEPAPDPSGPPPTTWNITTQGSAEAMLTTTAEGVMRIAIERTGGTEAWRIQLRGPRVDIRTKARYSVSFRARAANSRTVIVRISQSRPPWESAGLFREVPLTPDWEDHRFVFEGRIDEADATLGFNLAANDSTVEIADVVFRPEEDR